MSNVECRIRNSEFGIRHFTWPRLRFLLLALLFLGCPKRGQLAPPNDARTGLEQALAALDARKFKDAEDRLTFVIFNFPGTREAADAQYYLGETYFRSDNHNQAQTEFDFYLKSFPNGRFQEEATYKLGLAYFHSAPPRSRDQTQTLKAKEIFEEFLAGYPESALRSTVQAALAEVKRRLTNRDFDVARLYLKAGEYRSALTYYEYIAVRFPVDEWSSEEWLRLGTCYQETGEPQKARALFEQIVAGDGPPRLKREAAGRLARLN